MPKNKKRKKLTQTKNKTNKKKQQKNKPKNKTSPYKTKRTLEGEQFRPHGENIKKKRILLISIG